MSNYYKYVKRDEPQLLDWEGVTKTFSDKVMKPIEEERKAKGKAAQLSDKLGNYKTDLAKGKNATQSEFFGNAIQLIGKVNADLANAYKDGKGDISAQEYNIQAQSLISQYDLFKNYQTTYLQKYDDYIKDVSENGNIQNAFAASVEGFGNLRNLQLEYVDGKLVLQQFNDDNSREGEAQSIESLIGLTSFENSKFDPKAINDAKKTLTTVYQDTFGNTTVSDPTQNPTFNEALEGQVAAMLNGEHQIVEFLMGPGDYNKIETFKDFDPSQTGVIYMNTNANGIPQIVPEQKDALTTAAQEKLRNQLLGLMPRRETKKNVSTSNVNQRNQVSANKDFLINVNNLLTGAATAESSLAAISNLTSADDIDYVEKNGEVTAYVFSNFNDGKTTQTIELFDGNRKKSTQEVAEEFYNIYSNDKAGKTKTGRGGFSNAWSKSKLSSTDTYSAAKQDVLKIDQGDRKQNLTINIAGTPISKSPSDYLVAKPGDYVGLYNGSFVTRSKAGYVPKMYQGQANIKATGNDIKITLGKRTKFRHDPLNILIPKNISDSEHILVQEAIQNVLWDNPNIKKSAELLGLLDEEVDKLIPNNTIDFQ
jgi:hypothetical protein